MFSVRYAAMLFTCLGQIRTQKAKRQTASLQARMMRLQKAKVRHGRQSVMTLRTQERHQLDDVVRRWSVVYCESTACHYSKLIFVNSSVMCWCSLVLSYRSESMLYVHCMQVMLQDQRGLLTWPYQRAVQTVSYYNLCDTVQYSWSEMLNCKNWVFRN